MKVVMFKIDQVIQRHKYIFIIFCQFLNNKKNDWADFYILNNYFLVFLQRSKKSKAVV